MLASARRAARECGASLKGLTSRRAGLRFPCGCGFIVPMRTRRTFLSSFAGLPLAPAVFAMQKASSKGKFIAYIGTYTGQKSKGIYAYRFDAASGETEPLGLVAEAQNPTFLAIDPSNRYLYAALEINNFQGKRAGAVAGFAIDAATGKLTAINEVSSGGPGPCFVGVDKTAKNVLAANYGGGSIAVCPIGPDGKLSEATAFIQHTGSSVNPRRQREPHAHSINLSPDGRFAIVADLGLDKLLVYRFDAAKGTLAPNDPPFATLKPGSGPRHFVFHPNGKFAYALTELLNTVVAFSWDAAKGVFTELQTLPSLPADFSGNSSAAEIQVDAAGKFLYASNRGHDSIAVFAVEKNGTLKSVEHVPTQGKNPRNFRMDPTGAYLFAANQDTDNIVLFRVDGKTGRLTPAGKQLEVGRPVCVKFVPAK